MNTRCTICTHPRTASIDEALASGLSYAEVARRFESSRYALRRHVHDEHTAPVELLSTRVTISTLERLETLIERTVHALDQFESTARPRELIGALAELRHQYELAAKLLGELSTAPQVQVNILATPAFRQHLRTFRQVLVEVAGPEVAVEVARRLAASASDAAAADGYSLVGDVEPAGYEAS